MIKYEALAERDRGKGHQLLLLLWYENNGLRFQVFGNSEVAEVEAEAGQQEEEYDSEDCKEAAA